MRPSVSVIVPFAGTDEQLDALAASLGLIAATEHDELLIADNRRGATESQIGSVSVCAAGAVRTPAFARNAAAQRASGEWLVFIDADTRPAPNLIDAYLDVPPAPRSAVLAGGIVDVPGAETSVARYVAARRKLDQRLTLDRHGMPYAQSANCAIRRRAFEEVGGFAAQLRAGEDADLCFRLARAGWQLEARPAARVEHRSRATLFALLGQLARHGSGAAWLNRHYEDEFPPPRPLELAGRSLHHLREAAAALAAGEREKAIFALLDLASSWAFDLGRLLPNRPWPPGRRV
jgi:GT2 family glycosyltransferase